MNYKSLRITILSISTAVILIFMLCILAAYDKPTPISENGFFTIHEDDVDRGFVSVGGPFRVYDGLYNINELDDINVTPKLLSINDLRVYPYPKGSVTAIMTFNVEHTIIDGIILEEIYSANEVYINGTLISKVGKLGNHILDHYPKKDSKLIPLRDIGHHFDLVIKISNPAQISGQFERHVFIGKYNKLQDFRTKRGIIKFSGAIFYLTISLFLLSMFHKNKKYKYILTLSLAGIMNFYIIITHFEPILLFKPGGIPYTINSVLSTLPSLCSQFLIALTVLLFYKEKRILKNKQSFLTKNIIALLLVVTIVVIWDEKVNFIYMTALFYTLALIAYSMYICAKEYIKGNKSAYMMYFGLSVYLVTYITLIYITIFTRDTQTLSYYLIYLLLGQIFFYAISTYLTITKFSNTFNLSEHQGIRLEKLVMQRTNELLDSYNELLKQEEIRKQLLQDISHDLRSPITVIKGYVELLETGTIPTEDFSKYTNIIYRKTCYVSDLIDELSLLIKIESSPDFQMDYEYLDMIVNDVVSCYCCINISTNLEEGLMFYCNINHIYRLLNNLINNAIEYGGIGCSINISAYKDNDKFVLKVSDTGKGIKSEDLEKIFNRFTRVDNSRNLDENHFGLGLSICKAIVEKHNGFISCESTLGKGTTFTMTFLGGLGYENFNS